VYRTRILLASLFLLALIPARVEAQWVPGGISVCGTLCRPDLPKIVADGAGGVYVTWRDGRTYPTTGDEVYLQRVTAEGKIAPGWPQTGLLLDDSVDDEAPQGLVADESGGVLVVWESVAPATALDLYAQRVLGNGSIATGWPVGGVPITRAPESQSVSSLAPDGAGGLYVAWQDDRAVYSTTKADIYAQHLLADGSIAPGWIADGLPVCDDPSYQAGKVGVLADGAGGVILVWDDLRRGAPGVGDTYAQHLLADGSVAPGWVEDGLPVVLNLSFPEVALDGGGGFYVGCSTVNPLGFSGNYYAQRITFGGTVALGWPAAGTLVCAAPGDRGGLQLAPDGLGGLLMAWADYRSGSLDVYAARVLADGSLAPGWTVDGVQVSGTSQRPGSDFPVTIAPDGSGGMYLAWEWQIGTSYAMAQHLTASGAVAPGWLPGGIEVSPGTSGHFDPQVASDDAGGAIVVWEAAVVHDLLAQRFQTDGPVPALLALASAEAEPDHVTLTWQGPGAGALQAEVQRRMATSDWRRLGAAIPDGADRLRFEDRSVSAGERYAYRLSYIEDGVQQFTSEAWVDVPRALELALEGFRPNPVVMDRPVVAFALPAAGSARLDVLDVTGRRVLSRDVGALGPGRHAVRLDDGAHLAPGVYLIRLTREGRALRARGVVTR